MAEADADRLRRPSRQQLRSRQSARGDLAQAPRRGRQAEVMEDFAHNPLRNNDSYIPFLGTVADTETDAMENTPTPRQEEVNTTAPEQALHTPDESDHSNENVEGSAPAQHDKYAIAEKSSEEPQASVAALSAPAQTDKEESIIQRKEPGESAVAGRSREHMDKQPAIRSEPPPPPPLAHAPRVADLEPWRQQQYAPRPTRREVEEYRLRLQDRLLERYNNLPRFAGTVGKVSVVLSKPLDESLDGSLIRAEFDQLVYDPWGKRIPELEQEYYIVTFGAGGARQVRSDPSIRVGLDLEKTYSEQAPLAADPFRNVPERRVFQSTPTAAMPDWWRPDFPELNQ